MEAVFELRLRWKQSALSKTLTGGREMITIGAGE
jgi:hypothetical protein